MSLTIVSFLAGMLSVLAPCVLPILPVILGGSLGTKDRWRPLLIITSTIVCIVLFTFLLKVSTALIHIPQGFWSSLSAVIILLYGVILLRPELRERISYKLRLYKTNTLAQKAKSKKGIRGDILLGASLGPIFASCSPTYALLLSTVFPESVLQGLRYTFVYAIGFGILLGIFAYGGRSIISKFKGLSDPKGWFKQLLGFILIVTGLLIITGYMKDLETALIDAGFLGGSSIEERLLDNLPSTMAADTTSQTGQNCTLTGGDGEPILRNQELGSGDQTACGSVSGSTLSSGADYSVAENMDYEPGAQYLTENYEAPEFAGLGAWINSDGYNSIKDLSGKVVVIDFWTFNCINCIHTLPYVEQRYEKYKDQGLVVIGIHAPEFQSERILSNLQDAVKKYGLTFPIVQDNDFATRKAYGNRYRPARYVIDKNGHIRYIHNGEGAYDETEEVINYLLTM